VPDLWTRLTTSNEVLAVIVTAGLSLLAWFALRIIAPRGRLVWGVGHHFTFLTQNREGQRLLIHTRNIALQNVGRAVIENVELVLNYAPEHYEIWPKRAFAEVPTPNAFVVDFRSVNPRESVSLHMISAEVELPRVMAVRFRGGTGTEVLMAPQRLWPTWLLRLVVFVLLSGVVGLIYLVVRLIQAAAT
jgi:hypothetical protein